MRYFNLPVLMFLLLVFACDSPPPETKDGEKVSTSPDLISHVSAFRIQPTDFFHEILSQGKVHASRKADITFPLAENIEAITVHTGSRVKKGQVMARLNRFSLANQRKGIEIQLKQANLSIKRRLIQLGYGQDSTAVPAEIRENLMIEFNIHKLQNDLAKIQYDLAQTEIRAPFAGVVADLEAQPNNPSQNYKKLCTLISTHNLEVEFPILESELAFVNTGMTVEIEPMFAADRTFKGTIRHLNPIVDENGVISAFARIHNPGPNLLEGMSVNIKIRKIDRQQIVLPKAAVVDRQGRQVCFLFAGQRAHWNYVTVQEENTDSYLIAPGDIQFGDTAIVSNNFNLAHLERVILDSLVTITP